MKSNRKQRDARQLMRLGGAVLPLLLLILLAACAQVRLPAEAPEIRSFAAAPEAITAGESSVLSWEVAGADTVLLDGNEVEATGSRTVSPGQTTEYELSASNARGESTATATVQVRQEDSPPLIASFTAEPEQIESGETSVLSWHVVGADTISITPELGTVPQAVGSRVVSPDSTTRYTLTAANQYGSLTATVTVQVGSDAGNGLPLIAAFSASPEAIDAGSASTLSWSVEGAHEITISPDIGTVGSEGSETVQPTSTTTYTLRAANSEGSVSRSVTIHVREDPSSPPLIAFFTASPATVEPGDTATLRWAVAGADTVSINQGIGTVSHDSSTSVQPDETTVYTLTATNSNGQSQRTVTVRVGTAGDEPEPEPQLPAVAAFIADPVTGQAPLETIFYWVITDPDSQLSDISLDFGDGSSTSSSDLVGSVTHTYTSEGTHTAVLNATLRDGSSLSRSVSIAVTASAPPGGQPEIGGFTADPDTGPAPLEVSFSFEVSGGSGSLTCLIDFGDGSEPRELADCATGTASYRYGAPGIYQAMLLVTDEAGGLAYTTVIVRVEDGSDETSPLITAFEANPRSGEAPLDVSFSWSVSAPADVWLFYGDGSTPTSSTDSGSKNHVYAAEGRFPAVLLAISEDGTQDLQVLWVTVGRDWITVPTVVVRTGSTLVQLNQDERSLLAPLLAGLLGSDADLSVLSNDSLLQADVNLFGLLDLLAIDLGVTGPEAVLLETVDLSQVLSSVLTLVSGTAAELPLQEIISELPTGSLPLDLGELLDINTADIVALHEVDLNVLDLMTLLVQLFNAQNVAGTPQPVEIGLVDGPLGGLLDLLGVDSALGTNLSDDAIARLWLQVVEPPVITFAAEDQLGPTQAGFRSAGVRLALELTGLGVNVSLDAESDAGGLISGLLDTLLTILGELGVATLTGEVTLNLTELSLFAEVGSFDGYVSAIDLDAPSVTVNSGGSLVSLHLGELNHATFFDRNRSALPEAAFGKIATVDLDLGAEVVLVGEVLSLEGEVAVLARANSSRDLAASSTTLTGPYPQAAQVSSAAVGSQVTDLLDSLELELGAGLNELSVLGLQIGDVAGPLLDLVSDLVNTVLGLTDDVTGLATLLPLDELLAGLLGSDLFAALGLDLGANEITVLDLLTP